MKGTSKKLFSFILTVVAIVFCLFCFKVSVHADGSLSDVSSDSNKENVEAENTTDVLMESNGKQLADDTNKDLLKDDNKGSNDKAESNSTSQDSHVDLNSTRSSGLERIEKSADGKLYYIDSTGKRKTSAGWIYFDGKKYFASPGGSLYTNRMITFGSYGYYMGSDGSVLLGHFRGADRVYRYADAIGNLEDESYGKLAAVGWREDNYFAHGGYGALYHNQFISFGKVRYYMNTDGSVVKTEFNYGNKRYSPDPVTGEIKSGKAGWIIDKSKNTKKFAKGDGTLYINQMITFGSYGYYMGSDGSVLLGHFRGADRVYRYADAIGNLEDESYGKLAAVGWREDNYFAHGGYGALYHNQFISFGKVRYYMNTDGSVVKTEFNYGNKRYSPDPVTGEIKSGKAGWIIDKSKNTKKFAKGDGTLYINQMITFGSYGYYMGSDGSVLLGHFRGADRVYRYADAIGNLEDESYGKLAAVGWREDNYFAHGGYGELYNNQFITFGDKIYYMTGDGSVAKSKFQFMKGVIINPDPTGLISFSEYNYYLPQISAMQSARSILKQIGNSLWAAYKWAGSAITYKNMTTDADKGISYFANIAFNQRSGNCYTMASAFYYMALSLGYDVYQVSGFHQGRYKEWPHSWCEIRQNGGTYIYDPDILKEMDREIYGRKYGESGTLKYLVSQNKYMKL